MLAILLVAPLVALLAVCPAAANYNQTVLLMGIPDAKRRPLAYSYKISDKQCSARFPGQLFGCAVMPPRALQVEVRVDEIYPSIKVKPDLSEFRVRRHSRDCLGEAYITVEVACDLLESRSGSADDSSDANSNERKAAIPLEPES